MRNLTCKYFQPQIGFFYDSALKIRRFSPFLQLVNLMFTQIQQIFAILNYLFIHYLLGQCDIIEIELFLSVYFNFAQVLVKCLANWRIQLKQFLHTQLRDGLALRRFITHLQFSYLLIIFKFMSKFIFIFRTETTSIGESALPNKIKYKMNIIKIILHFFVFSELHQLCNLSTQKQNHPNQESNLGQNPRKVLCYRCTIRVSHNYFFFDPFATPNFIIRQRLYFIVTQLTMRKQVQNISTGAYLTGFPTLQTVELLVDSKQQFYSDKTRNTINIFRLFPKAALKPGGKFSGILHDSIQVISKQFQYEDDQQSFANNPKKKNATAKSSGSQTQGSIVHKTPYYKLYSPANLVLKEEYTILVPDCLQKIVSKEQQDILKEKIKDWIDIGYHIHVVQAFKIDIIQGRKLIFLQKLKGKTLRQWLKQKFFEDKNKYLNSKRALNCLLQIAVGLNYIHKRNVVHQQLIPDNIFIQNQKVLKIGNLISFNAIVGKMTKNSFAGCSPQYWSPQQGSLYENIKERSKQGQQGYLSVMKLLPAISPKSDLYQLGLICLQLAFGTRMWVRGDKAYLKGILQHQSQSNLNKQTTAFLFQKVQQLLKSKPQQRIALKNFIVELLDFYAANFKNAEDLLWCRFFDQEKYESQLLNNKAVGLYLSGNQSECQKYWTRSLQSNPLNLTAQYNYSHFKRMKRIIDDTKLNKDLYMLPQTRKRNFYLLVSNLVMLPLLKEPFKTYNFNPKLSRHKQIQILSNIIQALDKNKKASDYVYQMRYHLREYKFDEGHIAQGYFIGRLKGKNIFYCYSLKQDIKSYIFIQINSQKEPLPPQSRQAYSCVDPAEKYLAISQNSYLTIFYLQKLNTQQKVQNFHEIKDYGSAITTLQFDQKSEVLGIGSNQFTIKLLNLSSKDYFRVINIGQKFIIKNLQYYDRNTCIAYSYQKAISFHRIQTTKNLFTIRSNATVFNYRILQVTMTSHLMIVHTSQKFQVWNLKDKTLIRNIQIDQAPKIEGFFANSAKKMVVHFTKNAIRIWSYTNGLILKTYRTPISLVWTHVSEDAKYLRSLDAEGNFVTRFIDFSDFIKNFEGICVPNEICMTDEREQYGQDISQYIKLGRELVENLNDYRLNEQQKKVSLQKMYKIGETIKTSFFFQDKQDIKTIFQYLNGVRQSEDRSSRINSHSEQYIFTSTRQQFITATSNFNEGFWLIGESSGNVRMVTTPDRLVVSIRPKESPVTYLYLQPTSMFISYGSTCLLVDRDALNIIVTHTSYHKKNIRMGLVINSILVTGDEDQLILFWNKQKVRRYKVSVKMGDVVGKKLIIAGFDNRVRLYDIHPETGAQKSHVFIGHTMSIFNMVVIDDGIFTTYSYDGTIRWWNTTVKSCFSFFNFKKYFRNEKILWVDMPKFSLEEERHAKFDRQGCALVLLNSSEVVVFDTMRKQVKWKLQLTEEVVKVFWTNYPNTFAAVTYQQVKVISIYWRYMVVKK